MYKITFLTLNDTNFQVAIIVDMSKISIPTKFTFLKNAEQ